MHLKSVSAGLYYSVITPSLIEWRYTLKDKNNSDELYGQLHVWMRCVGSHLRGYFFLETLSDDLRDLSSNERVSLLSSKLLLYANNQLINSSIFTVGGGEFYLNTDKVMMSSNYLRESLVVQITVADWKHFASFPLSQCIPGNGNLKQYVSKPPKYVMSVYLMEDSSLQLDPAVQSHLAHSVSNHMNYHKCVLNISSYEIVLERHQVVHLMNNPILRHAAENGFLTFLTKENSPPKVLGKHYKWQVVYMNLIVLRHWTKNVRVFLMDPDEFIRIRPAMETELHLLLMKHHTVNFQRKMIVCADCIPHTAEYGYHVSEQKYWMSDHHISTKVALNPNSAGCMKVHFSLCAQSKMRLDSRVAEIAHFENLHLFRIDPNDKSLNFYSVDLSDMFSCFDWNNYNMTGDYNFTLIYDSLHLLYSKGSMKSSWIVNEYITSSYMEHEKELIAMFAGACCMLLFILFYWKRILQ